MKERRHLQLTTWRMSLDDDEESRESISSFSGYDRRCSLHILIRSYAVPAALCLVWKCVQLDEGRVFLTIDCIHALVLDLYCI